MEKTRAVRHKLTQEMVLKELERVYGRTNYLYKIWKQITEKMWDELKPEIAELIVKFIEDPHQKIDLNKYPALRLAVEEAERKHRQAVLDYYYIAYNVITESMKTTYKDTSKNIYKFMGETPYWKENSKANPVERHMAQTRITDTYITDKVLNIPWCQDGKVYSQRLWGHIANFQSKLDYVLKEGIENGRGMEWMEKAFRQLTGASAYDTARLLKTESMAVWSRATKDTYLEMGVEYVEIVGDAECGGICLDYVAGDAILLAEAEINDDLPPYHPNCACSFVAYEDAPPEHYQEEENEEE